MSAGQSNPAQNERHVEQPCAAWGTPCPPAQPCPCHPEPKAPADDVCGRLLIGQGDDTYDPLCVLASGHAGRCEPES